MKIYKFSNVLSLPFALVFLFFMSFLINDTHDMRVAWATLPLVCLVLIYLFQPQIDYWWLTKHPLEIDKEVLILISRCNSFYRNLSEIEKEEFNKRMVLYVNGREFSAKGMEKDTGVPYDIQYMIAQVPISMTFNKKNFLLNPYERIILYKHAFPSPQYRFLHTVETHQEDGVILFSMEHAEAAFFINDQYYNVAWHAFAEAFIQTNKWSITLPDEETCWETITMISNFSKNKISNTIGFAEPDIKTVLMVMFFTHGDGLRKRNEELYSQLESYLA